MSHYTVVVIKAHDSNLELSDILEPYNARIHMEPYVVRSKEEIILNLLAQQDEYKFYKDEIDIIGEEAFKEKYSKYLFSRVISFYDDKRDRLSDVELYLNYVNTRGKECFNTDGDEISSYNPNSKWDYFTVGGRWNGLLVNKSGKTADILKVKNIDFDKIITKSRAQKEYDKEIILNKKTKIAEKIYKNEFKSFKNFYEHRKYAITYAVLDSRNNKWIEPGQMSWFAMSNETSFTRADYYRTCHDLFLSLDPEDEVIIVDCHI